ncbi:MAG: adenosylmethionine decarboxylase [Candidatus Aenigmatarchaeota archaeon]
MKIKELLIDAYNCSGNLNNSRLLLSILIKSAKKVGAKVVNWLVHNYKPFGVSVVVLLAESHVSVYTWPEYKYAAIEIFLCNEKMNPELVWKNIKKYIRPKKYFIKKVYRSVK